MKKKVKIIIGLIIALCISVGMFFYLVQIKNKVHFFIYDQEKESYKQEIEYNDEIDISCKAIHLTAIRNGKDITDEITYKKVKMNKLKEYVVEYKVKGAIFKCTFIVKDKTAPVIEGEFNYSVNVNETFDVSSLKLTVIDNYDKDLTSKLEMDKIDTSKVGKQNIKVSVSDSSGNRQEKMITLEVKEIQAPIEQPKQVESQGNVTVSNPHDITVLVNKEHSLPDGWSPSDLVSFTSLNGQTHYLRQEATNKYLEMSAQAQREGILLYVVSSYRTQATQNQLYWSYYAKDPVNAPFYSAYSRTSEHELGLAIDVSYDAYLHGDMQNSKLGVWLAENAHKYGFILRYPYDKTNITQYMFEPWHYRYVGVNLATTLKNSNMTLEEYYGK